MIDHGTTCAGEPCTCSCYTRHVPLPGVHQDTPHPKSQCMSEWAASDCPPYCTAHNHEEMGG